MLSTLSIRRRLLILTLLPLGTLLVVIVLGLDIASRLSRHFEELFIDRMQPISQIKSVADAYAVDMVDALHQYRAGLLGDEQLRQTFATSRQKASVGHARRSGEVLQHIAAAVDCIADGSVQISAATEQQTAVANEISLNITSLNDCIQEVVSAAQQNSGASRELAQLANGLQQQAVRFRT